MNRNLGQIPSIPDSQQVPQQHSSMEQIHPGSRKAAPLPTYTNSGTVKPADCVAVNVNKPCIPLSQWQQMQQTASSGKSNICPADGWIMVQTGDVAVGHQCTPGQPVSASSGSGSGSAGGNSGSGSSGSDGAGSGSAFQTAAGLNDCIGVQYTKSGVLEFVSHCTQSAAILFFTDDAGRPLTEFVDPGKVDNTLLSGIKHLTYYACPYPGYTAENPDGTLIKQPVQQYVCRKGV